MLHLIEHESVGFQAIISECKGQPFPLCLEKYFVLKETSNNLKETLALILFSFPRDLDSMECLYNELFCVDSSKNISSLSTKSHKGLRYYFNGEDHDIVSLLLVFLQKILRLTERVQEPIVSLRVLRLIGGLIFFLPVEDKVVECRILVQKVLEYYREIRKDTLNIEYIELLALISFGMNVYTNLLVDDSGESIKEESSLLERLITEMKSESEIFEIIMDGLLLKIMHAGEEKHLEFYEIITRILNIKDPNHVGLDTVCEKFTRKILTQKVNRMLDSKLITSLRRKIIKEDYSVDASFWRDNLLLEVLRMERDAINSIAGGTNFQVYLDFMLRVTQPYREYEYKIFQRILLLDFGVKKDEWLILKKMQQIILSEEFSKHIHKNLFLIYYSLRLADLNKRNSHDKDFQNIYFSKIMAIPIPAYLYLFEKSSSKEQFSGREMRTQKKFSDELTFLLFKYFEFFFLPFSQLKLNSYKFEDKSIEKLIGDSHSNYEEQLEKVMFDCLDGLTSAEEKNKVTLEKKWYMLFYCDPVRTSQNTFLHFLKRTNKSEAYQSLLMNSFLDPLVFLLLDKKLFKDLRVTRILLQSLTVQLSVWETHSKEVAKGNIKKYIMLLKNSVVHYIIEVISLLKKSAGAVNNFKENISVICEYIHILCIEDSELIDGIIKEGFSFEMIDTIVDGVEWMHVCLFFADELLQARDCEKKVFYILLLSHIIKKYPTMSNYGLAKRMLEVDVKMKVDCSQINMVRYIKEGVNLLMKTFADLRSYEKEIQQFYSKYTLCW